MANIKQDCPSPGNCIVRMVILYFDSDVLLVCRRKLPSLRCKCTGRHWSSPKHIWLRFSPFRNSDVSLFEACGRYMMLIRSFQVHRDWLQLGWNYFGMRSASADADSFCAGEIWAAAEGKESVCEAAYAGRGLMRTMSVASYASRPCNHALS